LGYGLRGSDDARMQAYVKKNFMPGILKGYNSHNQYIETTLKAGLIGFLFFALLLFIPFIAAVRRGQMLPLVFLLQYMVQSLVEATLQVQHEQVFFWFFIFLFYLHFNKKTIVFG
jgi:O-antigen ligase